MWVNWLDVFGHKDAVTDPGHPSAATRLCDECGRENDSSEMMECFNVSNRKDQFDRIAADDASAKESKTRK